jgi:predicted DNA-binding protein YlxM (UPF0122 family)
MTKFMQGPEHVQRLEELKRVRKEAVEHFYAAAELARERRRIIEEFLADGFSRADVGRELGVSRQAIHKMIAVGREPRVARASRHDA